MNVGGHRCCETNRGRIDECTKRTRRCAVVWGLWFDGAFWFGTGSNTQKARNLAKNPNCIVGTQNAAEAVILEGVAEMITDTAMQKKLERPSLKKYGLSGGDGSEPLFRVTPKRIFGFIEKSFPKTATRWTFD